MDLTYFESGNLAVFILTFIGGLALSFVFKSKGISGCFTYVIAIIILLVIISTLVSGYSFFLEDITFNLQQYIYYNSVGIIGFIIGLLVGLLFKQKQ